MKVEITEEEREFLERTCARAEIFARAKIGRFPCEKDLIAIQKLKKKFKKIEEKK